MFKATLIENPNYYPLKKKLLWVGIPSTLLMGLLPNLFEMSGLMVVSIVMLFIAILTYQSGLGKELGKILKGRKIEIDVQEIRIKSSNGILEETMQIGPKTKIKVKDTYNFPEETTKDIYREMRGQHRKNYLIIEHDGNSRVLDFTIDSYYMIEQIKKVIAQWKVNGVDIKVVDPS